MHMGGGAGEDHKWMQNIDYSVQCKMIQTVSSSRKKKNRHSILTHVSSKKMILLNLFHQEELEHTSFFQEVTHYKNRNQ